MISYVAFWFLPLLSTLTTPVSAACNSAVTCLCGSSNNTYTLCIDDVRDNDNPCNAWLHCKTCQENQPHCETCPENRTGPMCLEVKQTRKKRQYVLSNRGFSGRLYGDGDISYGTSSCPRLESPDLGSMSCQQTSNFNSCTGRCIPGYSFIDSSQEQITLECRRGMWTPRQTFPPCISGGHCELNVDGAVNCTTGMDGTRCDIFCNGMHQGRYHCFPGRRWTPSLPYCATPKESSSSERPPPSCPCQNDGFCDSMGDCICPMGWTGIYCDRREREERPSCPDPGLPSGGDRVTEDGNPAPFPRSFSEGESVVFSCRGRDTALQGVSLIRCREDGTWSAARPRCIRDPSVVCPDPGIVSNADRINTDESPSTPDHVYTPGQSVVYNCRGGYRLRGNSMITCMRIGQWSGSAPRCSRIGNLLEGPNERSCRYPEPDINGFIEDDPPRRSRYPPGTQLTFGCEEGYRSVGAIMLYCLSTGDWTSLPPTCEEISSSETDPENQQVRNCPNLGPVKDGSFNVIGSPYIIGADDDEPEDDDSDFPPGTSLHYTCKDRFIIVGSDILDCSQAGYWNTEAPICVENCGRALMRTSHKLTNASYTDPGEWPWMVALAATVRNHTGVVCGGALIDNQTVLTAAHCVTDYPFFTLYFGKFYRRVINDDGKVETRRTTRIVIHEGYDNVTYNNDIALLRFEPSVDYSERIQPICLPTPNSTAKNILPGKMGSVTGWGTNENKLLSEKLMVAQLPVQTDDECMDAYEDFGLRREMHPGTFCAGYPEGVVSTCVGDSGSPLVFLDGEALRHTIEGVVSYGQNTRACDYERAYTVFTKVGHYMPWILRNWPCPSGMRRSGLNTCSHFTDEP